MSNTLTLRNTISPYNDITKGSVLSITELDNNLINLKGMSIYSAQTIGDTVSLLAYNGESFSFTIGSSGSSDMYWTSGSTGDYSVKSINDTNIDATGDYAHAEGYDTTASGGYSHSQNIRAKAFGIGAHAEGNNTTASGISSHAEGNLSKAIGISSHAEGRDTFSNDYAHAEGFASSAIGDSSHAEGRTTTAIGANSHAEGRLTTASGETSHAEGYRTTAAADYSHTEGYNTLTLGIYSHAGGLSSIASGINSFVHGSASTASGNGTIVLGSDITGTTENTTYVDNLNVKNLNNTESILSLGIDSDGYIVSANTNNISNAIYDVNYGLDASGTSINTLSICIYGVNVFTGVTANDYATKLPQPVTGKSVKIINLSTSILVVYPSNIGGNINNLPIDQPALIPPNGQLYEFICIENPLPGAWVWSTPATSQYDSGIITVDTSGGLNDIICAANSDNWTERSSGYYSATAWAYDGINNAPILNVPNTFVAFKPPAIWVGITKIKVYTNLSSTDSDVQFGLLASCGVNYYDTITDEFVDNGAIGAGNYRDVSNLYKNLTQTIGGATLSAGTLTTNIGDAGTCWGELTLIGGALGGYGSVIGDYFQGVVPYMSPPPTNVNQWYSGYISFQIRPRQMLSGFKFRFFIEHY